MFLQFTSTIRMKHRIRNRKAPFVFEVAVLELRGFIWIELAAHRSKHTWNVLYYTAGY